MLDLLQSNHFYWNDQQKKKSVETINLQGNQKLDQSFEE